MPFYLKESDIASQLAGLRSVLIVPCGFCPAASLALRDQKPYMEPLRRFLKTAAYESYMQRLQLRLQQQGFRTAVFPIKVPHGFVACMWTHGRRRAFAKRARQFDGVVVLGCEGAVQTVRDALRPGACRVIQGMEVEGLMNVVPSVAFPLTISLAMQGMTVPGMPPDQPPGAAREAPVGRGFSP